MEKNKLEVLYIITKLELGGAQKVCLTLFEEVHELGNEVNLITGSTGILIDRIKNKNNVIFLKNLKREISFSHLISEIFNFYNLVKEIKKLKNKHPNLIVHTHSTKAGIIGRWAALFAGVKKRIHTIHGFAFHKHQNKIKWLIYYFCELFTSLITTHFICVSSEDIKTGKKLFPNFKNKHSLIRAAIDYDNFLLASKKIKDFDSGTFIFGTISCFKKQKNLIDLFKAFEKVQNEIHNSVLEVIGDGELRTEFESWIKANNLQNKIILHGWKENVADIMINWNAFVLSSLWEGLPCSIVEARLLRLPVLSYKTGGIHDVIINGKNGFLYDQKDWENLANGMINLIQDKNLYINLRNFEDNLNEYKNITMIEQHIKLYQNINDV